MLTWNVSHSTVCLPLKLHLPSRAVAKWVVEQLAAERADLTTHSPSTTARDHSNRQTSNATLYLNEDPTIVSIKQDDDIVRMCWRQNKYLAQTTSPISEGIHTNSEGIRFPILLEIENVSR